MLMPVAADVGEEPAELTRLVGHQHANRRVCRGRGTVLARDPRVAGVAGGEARASVPRAPGASVDVGERVEGADHHGEVACEVGEHGAHGCGVAREDLGPQVRVAGRDPGDVAQALAGERDGRVVEASRRAATRLAASCGTWDTAATAASCSPGRRVLTAAPAEPRQLLHEPTTAVSVSSVGREHPRPAVEEVVPGGDRT